MQMPLQIKEAHGLPVRGERAPFTLGAPSSTTSLAIDGREIPIASYEGAPLDLVAQSIARVPSALRDLLTRVVISPTASPDDAAWSEKYRLPVLAAMGAVASGRISIFPHGIAQLRLPDGDVFVRNLMHELGHCWSLRDWALAPAGKEAWMNAITSDRGAPSHFAILSFRHSGWPHEDVAEATALYFLIRGTPAFDTYRTTMPARFALLDARFGGAS